MRFAARLAGVLLLVAGFAACDKAQIAQLQSQLATITVRVTNTDAELYNVWDLIEDSDLDGLPDGGQTFLFCERIPTGGPPITVPIDTAWNHSLRVSILRADSLEFEQVTDDIYLNTLANLSPYDDDVRFGANNVPKPDCNGDPGLVIGTRRFCFSNARQMSAVHRDVVVATSNPLFVLGPGTYGFRQGLCSVSTDPGPAVLGGAPQPLQFELGKGDTIRVEARKDTLPPAGLVDNALPTPQPLTQLEPVLIGALAIDGVTIVNLGGDPNSSAIQGDGISFTYTSR